LVAAGDLAWTDNCDAGGDVTGVDGPLVGGECGGTITRTWNVMDACGNPAATRTQIITVDDTSPPVIDSYGFEHEAFELVGEEEGPPLTLTYIALTLCGDGPFDWVDPEVTYCGDPVEDVDVTTVTDVGPVPAPAPYGDQTLHTRTITVKDACGNELTVIINLIIPVCPTDYYTLTQGGWSAPNRKKSGKGNNDKTNGVLRDVILQELLDKNEDPLLIGKLDGNYVKVEDADRKILRYLLPGGGPAEPLPDPTMVNSLSPLVDIEIEQLSDLLNKNGRFANVLIGQYVALQLNVWLNDCPEAAGAPLLPLGDLGNLILTPELCSLPSGTFEQCETLSPEEVSEYLHSLTPNIITVPQSVLDALEVEGLDPTVNGLLELTRRYLAGTLQEGTDISGSDLVTSLSAINEGFHDDSVWIDPALAEALYTNAN
jgi:hypothetical protein